MLNPQPVPATATPVTGAPSGDSSKPAKPPHTDTARDHFESVLFALVLALLFRTFEAEAFVIPTGSMLPRSMDATRNRPARTVNTRW